MTLSPLSAAAIVGKCLGISLPEKTGLYLASVWVCQKPLEDFHSSLLTLVRIVKHVMQLVQMFSQEELCTIALYDSRVKTVIVRCFLEVWTRHIFFISQDARLGIR